MNAAKPPLDDLNARMAVAWRSTATRSTRSATTASTDVADGPFDTKVAGLPEEPGLPEVQPEEGEEARRRRTRPRTAAQFSVVLEHTNDPANTAEAELIKEQLAKAGIDATLEAGRPDRVHHRRGRRELQHPAVAQAPRRRPRRAVRLVEHRARSLNFGKFNDPTLQALLDQGRARDRPGQAQADLPAGQQARSRRRSTTSGPTTPTGSIACEPEGAGPRRAAAARRRRQAARVPLRPAPVARALR